MKKKQYKITVEVLGEETSKTGRTILATLEKFKMGWEELKGKGVLTVEYGDKKVEKLMNAPTLRRIFNNDITRNLWAKNLEILIK